MQTMTPLRRARAGVLEVAYFECGPADGTPVLLMHGFPYDIHAYAEVAPRLAAQGCRVIVPELRGFGETRFLSADTPRSGEQAALGHDTAGQITFEGAPSLAHDGLTSLADPSGLRTGRSQRVSSHFWRVTRAPTAESFCSSDS